MVYGYYRKKKRLRLELWKMQKKNEKKKRKKKLKKVTEKDSTAEVKTSAGIECAGLVTDLVSRSCVSFYC